ncbi:hypothetical protein PRIPAC_95775 [Pristionchus pacificus]|uniref:Uncharacterized protein n=1 Tax=Pristionchus pacificus TaxID=54126 RepID=A0A2A6CUF6_PRIPA|nr:hypothetical protein PRIPAC_95775 [Pristionchus pacificus]|eukprot:PDM81748.1 hypothetical protein PRIPAC_30729 [Pristionchus pacificus]
MTKRKKKGSPNDDDDPFYDGFVQNQHKFFTMFSADDLETDPQFEDLDVDGDLLTEFENIELQHSNAPQAVGSGGVSGSTDMEELLSRFDQILFDKEEIGPSCSFNNTHASSHGNGSTSQGLASTNGSNSHNPPSFLFDDLISASFDPISYPSTSYAASSLSQLSIPSFSRSPFNRVPSSSSNVSAEVNSSRDQLIFTPSSLLPILDGLNTPVPDGFHSWSTARLRDFVIGLLRSVGLPEANAILYLRRHAQMSTGADQPSTSTAAVTSAALTQVPHSGEISQGSAEVEYGSESVNGRTTNGRILNPKKVNPENRFKPYSPKK